MYSAVGLNPHDARGRDWGLMIADMLPYVLGKDVVGTVSAPGQGVTSFKEGDRVMSLADASPGALQSGLQEYAIADVVNCAKIPDNISDDEAVCIFCYSTVETILGASVRTAVAAALHVLRAHDYGLSQIVGESVIQTDFAIC